jgi:hypothetical protein
LSGTHLAINAAQRDALWNILVPTAAQTSSGRQRFTATAHALRGPLRREINTVAKQGKKYDGEIVTMPGKPSLDLGQMHSFYAARLGDILLRLDAALRANGHFCTPDDEPFAQPIQVIVANERQAGRAAGTSNWTQWEDPVTVRRLMRIFTAGPKTKHGAQWLPYMPDGTRKRGAASLKNATAVWRGAFHDAQVAAHKSPANQAFKANIWLALGIGPRATLAADFHAALLQCRETLLAARNPAAAEFNPAIVPNPWALTEAEQEFKPAKAQVPVKYDEPASTFDAASNEPATSGALTDILDAYEQE